MPGYIRRLVHFVSVSLAPPNQLANGIAFALVLLFPAFGFIAGYLITRIIVEEILNAADRELHDATDNVTMALSSDPHFMENVTAALSADTDLKERVTNAIESKLSANPDFATNIAARISSAPQAKAMPALRKSHRPWRFCPGFADTSTVLISADRK